MCGGPFKDFDGVGPLGQAGYDNFLFFVHQSRYCMAVRYSKRKIGAGNSSGLWEEETVFIRDINLLFNKLPGLLESVPVGLPFSPILTG